MCYPANPPEAFPVTTGMEIAYAIESLKGAGYEVNLFMDCYMVYRDRRPWFSFINNGGKVDAIC